MLNLQMEIKAEIRKSPSLLGKSLSVPNKGRMSFEIEVNKRIFNLK